MDFHEAPAAGRWGVGFLEAGRSDAVRAAGPTMVGKYLVQPGNVCLWLQARRFGDLMVRNP